MIIPAILTDNFEEFKRQINRLSFAPIIQIDIMDGKFVAGKSFKEIDLIPSLNFDNKIELHLMVEHPLEEIEKWKNIKQIRSVVFHIECKDDTVEVIEKIKNSGWNAGIALCPETKVLSVLPYLKDVFEVVFLAVNPGAQGGAFVPEVQNNIIEFHRMIGPMSKQPKIAVDGGVNTDTIQQLKNCGAEIFCVGSAIVNAKDPKIAYNELNDLI